MQTASAPYGQHFYVPLCVCAGEVVLIKGVWMDANLNYFSLLTDQNVVDSDVQFCQSLVSIPGKSLQPLTSLCTLWIFTNCKSQNRERLTEGNRKLLVC